MSDFRTCIRMQPLTGMEGPRLSISASVPSLQRRSAVVVASSGSVRCFSTQRCCVLPRSATRQPFRLRHLVQTFRQTASQSPGSTAGDSGSMHVVSPTDSAGSNGTGSDAASMHSVRTTSVAFTASNGKYHSTNNAQYNNNLVHITNLPNGDYNGTGPSELKSAAVADFGAVELIHPPISPTSSTMSSAPTSIAAAPYTLSRALHAIYLFSRPHTMLGTTLSVISISLLALGAGPPSPLLANTAGIALLQALSAALLMNVSIVGINQLTDIAIDRVNKPTLPLASGEMTPAAGVAICLACTAAALAIGHASSSPPLMVTLVGSLLLGFFYSVELPFMRWKRSPLLAAGCILVVRAFLVQLGFYTHMAHAIGVFSWPSGAHLGSLVTGLFGGTGTAAASTGAAVTALVAGSGGVVGVAVGGVAATAAAGSAVTAAVAPGLFAVLQPLITRPLAFTVVFMLMFSVVIALFKDIPDVAGDTQEGISTFSVRLGPRKVFWTCIWILTAAYAGAIAFAFATLPASSCLPQLVFSVGGHLTMAAILWSNAFKVDFTSKAQITSFYMLVWKLFYAEYLIIPALQ